MEEDKASGPSDIALLGAEGVMAQTEFIAEAFKELFGFGRVCRVCRFNILSHNSCLHLSDKDLGWIVV